MSDITPVQIPDDAPEWAKALRKQYEAATKALTEKDTELAALKASDRDRSIKDLLSGKNAKPGLAKFIPETVDATEEAVTKWLEENGADLGWTPDTQQQTPTAPVVDATPLAQSRAAEQGAQVQQLVGDAAVIEAMNQFAATHTTDEFIAQWNSGGFGPRA